MKLAILAAALLITTPALADTSPGARRASDCERARAAGKTCELTIEALDVDGNRPDAGGTLVQVGRWGTHKSLIRLRRDFIDQILVSAEGI